MLETVSVPTAARTFPLRSDCRASSLAFARLALLLFERRQVEGVSTAALHEPDQTVSEFFAAREPNQACVVHIITAASLLARDDG